MVAAPTLAPARPNGNRVSRPRPASTVHAVEIENAESQADALLRIAADIELFKTPEDVPHARAKVGDHYETWSIPERGGGLRRWLVHEYYAMCGRAPNSNALAQAVEVLTANAMIDGKTHDVYVRLAEHDGALYLDIGDEHWHCIEITAEGWRVVTNPPVYFRRPRGMRPLPLPVPDGSLDELRPLIGPETDADWILIASWLLGTLQPHGPYPHLSLSGHAGAGKSTKTRFLRSIVDPSRAPTRKSPKEDRDIAVAAHNNRILALDNLSYMPQWLSDALCQLSTGAGDAYRSLYTDDEETIFNARRPVIINGIEEVATSGDLLDRLIRVELERVPGDKRQTEQELETAFTEAHPRILGALCTAASCALRNRGSVHLGTLPRMADFAVWIVAATPALSWTADDFLTAYAQNREHSIAVELEASPVAGALLSFMSDRQEWQGNANTLLSLLTSEIDEAMRKSGRFPVSPNGLSRALARLAPSLQSSENITISRGYDNSAQRRFIHIGRCKPEPSTTPPPAPTPPTTPPTPPTPPAEPDAQERPVSDTQERQGRQEGTQDSAPAWYEGEPWYTPSRPDSALSQALTWACHRNVNLATVWCSSKKLQERWAQGQYIITGEDGKGTTPAAFMRDLHRYYEQRRFVVLREIAKTLDIEPPDRVVRSGQVQEGA